MPAHSLILCEDELLPGDGLFFDFAVGGNDIDHVAMYVGDQGTYDIVSAADENRGVVRANLNIYKNLNEFKDFRRFHPGDVEMKIETGSPVNLIVQDPDGNTLSYEDVEVTEFESLRGIPGEMYYLEMEQSHDGRPVDIVYGPKAKSGIYNIVVVPDETAAPSDTYSLVVTIQGQTKILATNEPIGDVSIPKPFQFMVVDKKVNPEIVIPTQPSAPTQKTSRKSSGNRIITTPITTSYNLSILQGHFDQEIIISNYQWQLKNIPAPALYRSSLLLNQTTPTTIELLLFSNGTLSNPQIFMRKNNKIEPL